MGADHNDRHVIEQDDGWAILSARDEQAAGVLFPTQLEAVKVARKVIERAGGGDLIVRRRDGQVRLKETISGADVFTGARDDARPMPVAGAGLVGRVRVNQPTPLVKREKPRSSR